MSRAKLKGLQYLLLAAALALAGCVEVTQETDGGNEPVHVGNQVVTIHSPLANGLYALTDPLLTFTATETLNDVPTDIPQERLNAAVHDVVDGQNANTQALSAVFSGARLPPVGDGLHKLEFGVDNQGQFPNFVTVLFYGTDTTTPVIQITIPDSELTQDGSWLTNDPSPVIDYVILDPCFQDPDNPCTAEVYVNGVRVDLRDSTVDSSCPRLCLPTLDDGTYHIKVTYTDAAGWEGRIDFTIIIDATPPEVVVEETPPSGGGTAEDPAPTVTTSRTAEGLTFTSSEDGSAVVILDDTTTIQVFDNVLAGTDYAVDLTGVGEGVHSVKIVVTDSAGQDGVAEVFTTDESAPGLLVWVDSLIQPGTSINVDHGSLIFSLDEPGSVVVTLDIGTAGERELANIAEAAAGQDYQVNVTALTIGDHTVTFNVADPLGNATVRDFTFSVVDASVPTVTLTQPNQPLFSTPEVPLSFTFSDDFTSQENLALNVTYSVTQWDSAHGEWIAADAQVIDVPCCTIVVNQDGLFQVTVTVTDESQNTNWVTTSFAVDTTEPVVEVHILKPCGETGDCPDDPFVAENGITGDSTPRLSVSANEQSEYGVKIFMFEGGFRPYSDLDWAQWLEVDGDLTQANGAPLTDGPYTVVVEVTDAAGWTGVGWTTFTVEAVPPSLAIRDPVEGHVYTNPDSNLKFKFDVVEETTRVEIYLALEGEPLPAQPYLEPDTISPAQRTYTHNVPMPADGSYVATFIAYDADRQGDDAVWQGTVSFTVDSSAVEITQPNAEDRHFRSEETVLLSFNYNAADTIEIRLDDVTKTQDVDGNPIDPANQPIRLATGLGEGTHQIKVIGTNDTRVSESVASFVIDNTAPVVTISNPNDGGEYTTTSLTLDFRATDEGAGEIDPATWAGTLSQGGVVLLEGLKDGDKITDLTPGDYLFVARVADKAGNEGEASAGFTILAPPGDDDDEHHGRGNRRGHSSCQHDPIAGDSSALLELLECTSGHRNEHGDRN